MEVLPVPPNETQAVTGRSGVVSDFQEPRLGAPRDPDLRVGEPMSKNKGGREVRKPKQPKKPKATPAGANSLRIEGTVKKTK